MFEYYLRVDYLVYFIKFSLMSRIISKISDLKGR
ncbi:hypothetical protein CLV98_105157 [Dyadobacter jejuensis]|uniref:Uncharacterized protein n=1 Tax=Dyadobacter jejuensis TaxID=1082580 RepID=A0A316B5Q8_9BACT|nr:hypothetical protein CLV98_105157 [Dyadobacter jejuensis]